MLDALAACDNSVIQRCATSLQIKKILQNSISICVTYNSGTPPHEMESNINPKVGLAIRILYT